MSAGRTFGIHITYPGAFMPVMAILTKPVGASFPLLDLALKIALTTIAAWISAVALIIVVALPIVFAIAVVPPVVEVTHDAGRIDQVDW